MVFLGGTLGASSAPWGSNTNLLLDIDNFCTASYITLCKRYRYVAADPLVYITCSENALLLGTLCSQEQTILRIRVLLEALSSKNRVNLGAELF